MKSLKPFHLRRITVSAQASSKVRLRELRPVDNQELHSFHPFKSHSSNPQESNLDEPKPIRIELASFEL
jgi:hypothetical protein